MLKPLQGKAFQGPYDVQELLEECGWGGRKGSRTPSGVGLWLRQRRFRDFRAHLGWGRGGLRPISPALVEVVLRNGLGLGEERDERERFLAGWADEGKHLVDPGQEGGPLGGARGGCVRWLAWCLLWIGRRGRRLRALGGGRGSGRNGRRDSSRLPKGRTGAPRARNGGVRKGRGFRWHRGVPGNDSPGHEIDRKANAGARPFRVQAHGSECLTRCVEPTGNSKEGPSREHLHDERGRMGPPNRNRGR